MLKENRILIILWLFVTTLFFIHLGRLYPDIMEARNFVSVREMVEDGHWLKTTMNDEPRYEKPPLPTWLSAVTGEIGGLHNVFALRVPAALVSILLMIYFYKLIKDFTANKDWAIWGTFVAATSFLIIFVGQRATWDIFAYAFGLIGSYYLLKAWKYDTKLGLNYTLCGFFLGLSFLSKGPTGIYVFTLPMVLAYLLQFGIPDVKKHILWFIYAIVLALFVGLIWYLYIYLVDGNELVRILDKEAVSRTNRDVKPISRYVSFFIQMGIWALFSLLSLFFPFFLPKSEQKKQLLFFWFWTIFSLVLISLIPSKKERYLFPVLIPLAALTARYLQLVIFNAKEYKPFWKNVTKYAWVVLGVVLLLPPFFLGFIDVGFNVYTLLFDLSSILAGLLLLNYTLRVSNLKACFVVSVAYMYLVMLFGLPVFDSFLNSNPNYSSFVSHKKEIEEKGIPLYSLEIYSPELWFKYGEIIPEYSLDKVKSLSDNNFYLLTNQSDVALAQIDELRHLNWNITLIDSNDDNESRSGNKNYSNRKKTRLYLVNKL